MLFEDIGAFIYNAAYKPNGIGLFVPFYSLQAKVGLTLRHLRCSWQAADGGRPRDG